MKLPDRFLHWTVDAKGGKYPCDAQGKAIDPHDPKNWRSYADAAATASGSIRVGWVLNGDGWFFLDLDKCCDENGWWTDAEMIYKSFPGALGEVSQSGRGLHIIGRCDPSKLEDRRNKWDGWKEFYTDKRFVALNTITGGDECADTDHTHMLLQIVPQREFLGELPEGRDPTYTGPEDDDELIAMMLRSSNAASAFGGGVTFKDLWEANAERLATRYPDPERPFDRSAADAGIMSHFAFWTGKDMRRMDRLFRRSGLMRDKYEKREDYRRNTFQNAVRLCNRVYDHGQTVTFNENEAWEPLPQHYQEPEKLPAPQLDPSAFLTQELAGWVIEAAEVKCAPVDFVFWTLLSVSASLIGNTRRVCPYPSWSQPVTLWTICIGIPSAGKSPAMDAILDPLRTVEKPLKAKAARAHEAWLAKKKIAEMAEAEWKKKVRKAVSNDCPPPPMPAAMQIDPEPHMPRLMITDSTIEKLAMICQRQPKGVLQVRDELAGWLHGMSRYSSSSDRPFWLIVLKNSFLIAG